VLSQGKDRYESPIMCQEESGGGGQKTLRIWGRRGRNSWRTNERGGKKNKLLAISMEGAALTPLRGGEGEDHFIRQRRMSTGGKE